VRIPGNSQQPSVNTPDNVGDLVLRTGVVHHVQQRPQGPAHELLQLAERAERVDVVHSCDLRATGAAYESRSSALTI
jgi:hypothetical protein